MMRNRAVAEGKEPVRNGGNEALGAKGMESLAPGKRNGVSDKGYAKVWQHDHRIVTEALKLIGLRHRVTAGRKEPVINVKT